MTAADYLAQIEARAEAATEGPWDVASDADTYLKPTDVVGPGEPGERFIICEYAGQDAEFIAHARADVPALVAALRAVLDELDQWERVGHLSIEMVHIRRRVEQALGGEPR